MSLVYHVSVIEGTDRIEAPDRESSIHAGVEGVDRRLSYNPLAQPEDTQAIADVVGVGAHFVSKRRRIGACVSTGTQAGALLTIHFSEQPTSLLGSSLAFLHRASHMDSQL